MNKSGKKQADLGTSPTMWGTRQIRVESGRERGTWFPESRFAMFIHWGLYSEAAGCWKGRTYHGIAEWLMHTARIPVKEYETLAGRFNPVNFNARAWTRLAKAAGMKYIVITAKHHDGFAMFKSQASPYNIVDATPFGRDPLRELAQACRRDGLRLGFYYSQFQDWHERDAAGNTWDFPARGDFKKYLREKAMPQIEELLTNYGPVGLIWFDTPGNISGEASQELLNRVRRLQPDCLVNSRIGNGLGDYVTLHDQEIPLTAPDGLWETIDTHNDTWGFARNDHNWKSARELISRLTRLASLGGNYMLNVGPDGRGIIPRDSEMILKQVGAWLHRNGDSIYGTRRSPIGMQAWGPVTCRDNHLYLQILECPRNGELWVPGVASIAKRARFLTSHGALKMTRKGNHMRLVLPAPPPDEPVTVIELTTRNSSPAGKGVTWIHPGLMNELSAPFAALRSCRPGRRSWMEEFGDWHHADVIEDWQDGAEARWKFTALAKEVFYLYADYECWAETENSEFEVTVGDQKWRFPALYTGGGKGLRIRFRRIRLGRVRIPAGAGTLVVRNRKINDKRGFVLRAVVLEPA